MEKKLGNILKGIEKENAVDNWPNTKEKLSQMMIDQAQKGGYGALLVGVMSQQVKEMLLEWAKEQELDTEETFAQFQPAVWLKWGEPPIWVPSNFPTILSNGVLKLPAEEDKEPND